MFLMKLTISAKEVECDIEQLHVFPNTFELSFKRKFLGSVFLLPVLALCQTSHHTDFTFAGKYYLATLLTSTTVTWSS